MNYNISEEKLREICTLLEENILNDYEISDITKISSNIVKQIRNKQSHLKISKDYSMHKKRIYKYTVPIVIYPELLEGEIEFRRIKDYYPEVKDVYYISNTGRIYNTQSNIFIISRPHQYSETYIVQRVDLVVEPYMKLARNRKHYILNNLIKNCFPEY